MTILCYVIHASCVLRDLLDLFSKVVSIVKCKMRVIVYFYHVALSIFSSLSMVGAMFAFSQAIFENTKTVASIASIQQKKKKKPYALIC